MDRDGRAWGAFGSFSLSGELPREERLTRIETQIAKLRTPNGSPEQDRSRRLAELQSHWLEEARRIYGTLEPWETVFVARHPRRPVFYDYVGQIVHDFCELHGDGLAGDDPAVVTGLGRIGDHGVMIVGQNRGRQLDERVSCRFGCAQPEGFRKALAKMQLAAKYGIPIVSLIDTPGAYPGMESEQRGIARAIARNLAAMPNLRVPIVSVVIGEGGSGGALGIAVSDRLAMLEHSIFSVISPEGCSAILWKTSAQAKEAAAALKMRAKDLLEMGLIDEVIAEPVGGAHHHPAEAIAAVERYVIRTLDELKRVPIDQLLERRYRRIRTLGSAFEQDGSGFPAPPAFHRPITTPGARKKADIAAQAS